MRKDLTNESGRSGATADRRSPDSDPTITTACDHSRDNAFGRLTELNNGSATAVAKALRDEPSGRFRRSWSFGSYLVGLALVFFIPLRNLISLASVSQLHSHILLIPLVCAYLIYIRREDLPLDSHRSIGGSIASLCAGLACLAIAFGWYAAVESPSDHLALTILAFVCFVAAGGFIFLGKEWMRSLAFPFAFLIFLVPLPDGVVVWLETASQVASADAAELFFHLSGTPILRDNMLFALPGMIIEVAQECSGIRSSLVLFITSLVAAYLFLHGPWRRLVLVAFVIPLGILRNGIRIVVIGLLCVHYGPQMIHSVIHRKGGPVFFALSLIPLFLLLWWLRRGEAKQNTEA
ncbi:MAG: archaeosortase/exosortase family protein [Chthoniobacterales bacterium]|nr:archaeosortase/exosortase family protein [Chthoniobacterales bacterium]